MTGPWRDVEHIERHSGGRGGAFWWLRLSCGHHESRPCPTGGIDKLLAMGADRFVAHITAPRRVRCLLCGLRQADEKKSLASENPEG